MSAPDIAALFDVWKVKRTELVGKAQQWIGAFLATDTDASDPVKAPADSDETEPAQWWQHYGFASRPPADAETLVVRVGGTFAAIASRVAAAVYGKLAQGDAAMFTIGGNVLKLGVNGSATFIAPVEGSTQQAVASYSPKDGGSFKLFIPNGPAIEISAKQGISFNAGTESLTLATAGNIQAIGAAFNNNCGVFKTHMAASKPMAGGAATPAAPNVLL